MNAKRLKYRLDAGEKVTLVNAINGMGKQWF